MENGLKCTVCFICNIVWNLFSWSSQFQYCSFKNSKLFLTHIEFRHYVSLMLHKLITSLLLLYLNFSHVLTSYRILKIVFSHTHAPLSKFLSPFYRLTYLHDLLIFASSFIIVSVSWASTSLPLISSSSLLAKKSY